MGKNGWYPTPQQMWEMKIVPQVEAQLLDEERAAFKAIAEQGKAIKLWHGILTVEFPADIFETFKELYAQRCICAFCHHIGVTAFCNYMSLTNSLIEFAIQGQTQVRDDEATRRRRINAAVSHLTTALNSIEDGLTNLTGVTGLETNHARLIEEYNNLAQAQHDLLRSIGESMFREWK